MRNTPVTTVRRRSFDQEDSPMWLLRLETWLAVSSLALVFQLFPAAFWAILSAIDVRNWTWGVWVGVEIAIIVALILLKAWHNAQE